MRLDKAPGIRRQCRAALGLAGAVMLWPAASVGATVLVEQPTLSGIAHNIFVAHVTNAGMPVGTFDLVVEQPDPLSSSGYLVPTSWNAASQTGFAPTSPATAQLGFRNQAGTSTAQMEGAVVGAYLNSQDLPTTRKNQKMMIAPQYIFPAGAGPVVFSNSSSVLNSEMDLQVPVATGTSTYVSADFLLVGPNGVHVTIDVKLFHNGSNGALFDTGYDSSANVYMVNCPLGADTQYLTKASSSSTSAGIPWVGWRHFQWSIDQPQFVAALKQLAAKYPSKLQSTDPTLYVLSAFHLNAEFHYAPTSAELGWSMRGLRIWQ